MRMPKAWRIALDNFGRCEGKTLTEVILAALENTYPAVLHPVLHGESHLQDRAPSMAFHLGQNARLGSKISARATSRPQLRVPVERDHRFRWKMIAQSGGT
jgi:hypothetical protein